MDERSDPYHLCMKSLKELAYAAYCAGIEDSTGLDVSTLDDTREVDRRFEVFWAQWHTATPVITAEGLRVHP